METRLLIVYGPDMEVKQVIKLEPGQTEQDFMFRVQRLVTRFEDMPETIQVNGNESYTREKLREIVYAMREAGLSDIRIFNVLFTISPNDWDPAMVRDWVRTFIWDFLQGND